MGSDFFLPFSKRKIGKIRLLFSQKNRVFLPIFSPKVIQSRKNEVDFSLHSFDLNSDKKLNFVRIERIANVRWKIIRKIEELVVETMEKFLSKNGKKPHSYAGAVVLFPMARWFTAITGNFRTKSVPNRVFWKGNARMEASTERFTTLEPSYMRHKSPYQDGLQREIG